MGSDGQPIPGNSDVLELGAWFHSDDYKPNSRLGKAVGDKALAMLRRDVLVECEPRLQGKKLGRVVVLLCEDPSPDGVAPVTCLGASPGSCLQQVAKLTERKGFRLLV